MAAAAPAQLSGLANLLLRRPPSLRELVTLVGYADDYAWFVGLARRLFPQEAEAALSAPDVRGRVERFANLFGERHFPLYAPFIEFWTEEEGEQPPWSWLTAGHPLRPDGLRLRRPPRDVGRLPRGLLGPRPPGPAPRFLLHGRRRDTGGLAGVSRRTHPAGDIGRGFPRAAYPWTTSPRRLRRRSSRGRRRPLPGSSPRPATSSSTTPTRTAITTASPTPGTTTSSRRARRSGAKPAPLWTQWAS